MLSRLTLFALLAGLCLGQDVARKEITLDPQTLTRYVGAYQMDSGAQMLITLANNQLFAKLGNQQPIAIFPESKTMFFLKVVNAEIEFTKDDAQGRPAGLILHQNGSNVGAKRFDDAQAKLLLDAAAAFAKRFKNQTAAPGGEAALRKMIVGLGSGNPDYDSMAPEFAELTRSELTNIQAEISKLGSMRTVTFKRVGPGGADIYVVEFERGALEFRIWLARDGKVEDAGFSNTNMVVSAASLRPRLPEIDSLISGELARRPVGSVTAGVVDGKELIWSKSYGDADMEKNIPANADTRLPHRFHPKPGAAIRCRMAPSTPPSGTLPASPLFSWSKDRRAC